MPSPSPFLFILLLSFLFSSATSDEEGSDLCPLISDGSPPSCPVSCFRPDPVCGADGVTYWCGCTEAACARAAVAKRGFCDVGNGATGLVSGQAFLLVHIIWLIVLGFSVLCGFF